MNPDKLVYRLKQLGPIARADELAKIEKEYGRGFSLQVKEALDRADAEPHKARRSHRAR